MISEIAKTVGETIQVSSMEVSKLLEQVASALKIPVEFVWEQVLRQNYYYATADLVFAGIFLVIFLISLPFYIRMFSAKYGGYTWEDLAILVPIFHAIFSVMFISVLVPCGIRRLVVPALCAMQDLINIVSDLKG
jgi:hypothetical protein